jgi:hypothetical protein
VLACSRTENKYKCGYQEGLLRAAIHNRDPEAESEYFDTDWKSKHVTLLGHAVMI